MPLYSASGSGLCLPKVDCLYLDTTGDKMTGDINMGGFQICNVESPVRSADVSTEAYVDSQIQSIKIILQAEMDQCSNNITHKFSFMAGVANIATTLVVPIEKL